VLNDCVRLAVPQATEWQRIGDQIDAPQSSGNQSAILCSGPLASSIG